MNPKPVCRAILSRMHTSSMKLVHSEEQRWGTKGHLHTGRAEGCEPHCAVQAAYGSGMDESGVRPMQRAAAPGFDPETCCCPVSKVPGSFPLSPSAGQSCQLQQCFARREQAVFEQLRAWRELLGHREHAYGRTSGGLAAEQLAI